MTPGDRLDWEACPQLWEGSPCGTVRDVAIHKLETRVLTFRFARQSCRYPPLCGQRQMLHCPGGNGLQAGEGELYEIALQVGLF